MEVLLLMVTIASTLLGIGMSAVLWRAAQTQRQQAAVRVAQLRRLAFSDGTPTMFESADEHGATKRRAIAVTAVAAGMLSFAALAFALHDAASPRVELPAARTVELLALRHATDVRGDFVVSGEVRGARESGALSRVSATVELVDREGRRVASRRAALAAGVLRPGEMSSFTVAFPQSRGVTKYQVQFRLADGSLVRHVDRRAGSGDDTFERTAHVPAN